MRHHLSRRCGATDWRSRQMTTYQERTQERTLRRGGGDTIKPTQTGLLLLPNFSLLGVIAAIDVMRHANRLSRKNLYAWRTYSSDGAAVRASNGLVLNAERIPPADAALDSIFVCGGFNPERVKDPALFR